MSGHCQDYAMPDSLIKPGQVCAALFAEDNNWHRVTITDVRQDGFIEVSNKFHHFVYIRKTFSCNVFGIAKKF